MSRVFASPLRLNGLRRGWPATTTSSRVLVRTTDFGKTWTAIARALPPSPINVVVQDRRNKDLLIIGNDQGRASTDAAESWGA